MRSSAGKVRPLHSAARGADSEVVEDMECGGGAESKESSASVAEAEDELAGPPEKGRPPELSPVGALDIAELEALVAQGKIDADAVLLGAGFMGGNGRAMVFFWAFFAAANSGLVVASFLQRWRWWLQSILLFNVFGTGGRAYCLVARLYREGVIILGIMFSGIGLSLYCGAVVVLSTHSTPGAFLTAGVILCYFVGGTVTTATGVCMFLGRLKGASNGMLCIWGMLALFGVAFTFADPFVGPGLFVAFGACLAYSLKQRRDKMRRANRDIAGDKARYDGEWEKIRVPAAADVEALSAAVARRTSPTGHAATNRYSHDVYRRLFETSQAFGAAYKPRQRIKNISVLFRQAYQLSDHFHKLVKVKWAAGATAVVKSPPVKRRARAIEKLHRSYNGDAGRLIDIVRDSVSFATMGDLVECFNRIAADDRVALLNVKNRFDPDFGTSAGYRNLALSLAIVDRWTMRRGLDHHVCELQLGLHALEEIKNKEGGHDRYVKWRNERAE